jgi:uncharacterized protein YcbX
MHCNVVGTVAEIWRYPISSIGGEKLSATSLNAAGSHGDREWCLVDAATGLAAAPEKEPRWRPALFLNARLEASMPEIGLPDGHWLFVDDEKLKTKLFEHFSFDVDIRPTAKCQSRPLGKVVAENRYTPSPVHLLTTGSLDQVAKLMSTSEVRSRRFRPTILLSTETTEQFMESSWLGHAIRIGGATLWAVDETKRCGMTLVAQPGIVEEPDVLRAIVRKNRRNLGIYCDVIESGNVSTGDEAHLVTEID